MNVKITYLITFGVVWLVVFGLCGLQPAIASEGNISPNDKYAWAENAGWINFRPTHGGVTVYPDHLEGYAWAENIGWVKFGSHSGGGAHTYGNSSSADWGVNHDSVGNLSGFAWSETTGWINFNPTHSQVTIDPATGEFDGYAWAENVGWIHFQNSSPAYKVELTDPLLVRWAQISPAERLWIPSGGFIDEERFDFAVIGQVMNVGWLDIILEEMSFKFYEDDPFKFNDQRLDMYFPPSDDGPYGGYRKLLDIELAPGEPYDFNVPFQVTGRALEESYSTRLTELYYLEFLVEGSFTYLDGVETLKADFWVTSSRRPIIPEPGTLVLFGCGLIALVVLGKKKLFRK